MSDLEVVGSAFKFPPVLDLYAETVITGAN